MSQQGVIFGLGNPLLDISAVVPAEFLAKYGLEPANAILAEEKHVPIYDDMRANYAVEYLAGGATQNSIRVAQWMMGTPKACAFTGCIGKDEYGAELRRAAEAAGVDVLYQEHATERTGTCAVCVVDHERSLCANIAACNSFDTAHLDTPEVKAAMDRAKVFYVASFFLTANPDAAVKLAEHAHDT
jgi:adenosine kinase